MLKRDDPFTPQPRRTKKTKDHATPGIKTPLRNMLSAENVAAAAAVPPMAAAQHHQQRRKRALLSRNRSGADLLSPAPGISPKAAPLSIHSPLNVAHASRLRPSPSAASSALSNQKLSIEQMTRSFEEWMRIAADNKINAKNTWNFALIDYFSELTFLRDEDDEKSINFQKASCTLDGCVKIYSSRVDAAMDEAGKLLNGLNERSGAKGDSDSDDEERETEPETKKAARKHSRPPGETLEKNPENLSVKGKLDMQGDTIDPLFKKTCVDFDEATGGSLLFNLMVDQQCKVVFDSNQSLDDWSGDSSTDARFDASSIISTFGVSLSSLQDRSLTATLDSYSFLQPDGWGNIHDRLAASLEKLSVAPDEDSGRTAEDNPFDSHPPTEHPPRDNFAFLDEAAEYDDDDGGLALGEQSFEQLALGFSAAGAGVGPSFEFLEEPGRMRTTWAGVEHWKIKRVNSSAKAKTAPVHVPRTKKWTTLDFASTDVDLESLLAKGANLSAARTDSLMEATTLPDDFHISSLQFTRLFIKPAWRFSQVKTRAAGHGQHVEFVEQPNPAMPHAVDEPHPPAFDDFDYDAADYSPVDLSQSLVTLQPAQQTALSVNYARRAKRVDVHLLKDCIRQTVASSKDSTRLSQVVHSLPAQYTEAARGDLSVQYAFICLLHLANETGLSITEQPDGDLCIASNEQ